MVVSIWVLACRRLNHSGINVAGLYIGTWHPSYTSEAKQQDLFQTISILILQVKGILDVQVRLETSVSSSLCHPSFYGKWDEEILNFDCQDTETWKLCGMFFLYVAQIVICGNWVELFSKQSTLCIEQSDWGLRIHRNDRLMICFEIHLPTLVVSLSLSVKETPLANMYLSPLRRQQWAGIMYKEPWPLLIKLEGHSTFTDWTWPPWICLLVSYSSLIELI